LLPGEDSALRSKLMYWLAAHQLHPLIAGEFDDSALMSAFGQAGAGFFAAPTAIADMVMRQYEVQLAGSTDEIKEEFYAISVQRKLTHPAVLAISRAAQKALFGEPLPKATKAV
jgi:LysR family transcriptional activator of nhaA